MKKNRPGVLLTVLTDKEHEEKLVDIILTETTTLGIRKTTAQRYVLEREIKHVNTEFGKIRVKESSFAITRNIRRNLKTVKKWPRN